MARTKTSGATVNESPSAWFGDSFRKVHILFISPTWARNRGHQFDANQYASQLSEAGVDCIEFHCKDHHGVCYFPCSLGLTYPQDVVGSLVEACRAKGIRFIAYVSVGLDNHALAQNPEWQVVDGSGRPWRMGPFKWACLRSPYRRYLLTQIEELVSRYQVDGLWLDILPLAWPSPQTTTALGGPEASLWMIHDAPIPCYCESCSSQFESELGRPLPRHPSEDDRLVAFQFELDGVRQFLAETKLTLRKSAPQAILTYNGAGCPGDPLDVGDLVSVEGHAPNYDRQSFIARWGRSSGKHFEILSAGGLPGSPTGWNGFDQKPTTLMQLEASIALAHGGSTVFGQVPYPDGSTDLGQYHGFARVFRPIAQSDHLYRRPTSVTDTLLALPVKPLTAPRQWGAAVEGAEFWHQCLRDDHALYDVGRLPRQLDPYRLVILPDQQAMSDEEIEAIRDFVHAGGHLLATGSTSLYDANGRPRDDFGLSDVFGVSYRSQSGRAFAYLRPTESDPAGGLTENPILINREPLSVTVRNGKVRASVIYPEARFSEGTTILWGYPGPDSQEVHPGAITREFGSGLCTYVPVPLDSGPRLSWPWDTRGFEGLWIKKFCLWLIRDLLPHRLLETDAPPGVEMVLNQHDGYLVLHLVNYYAGESVHLPFDPTTIRMAGIKVRINRSVLSGIRRARVVGGAELEFRTDEHWLSMEVPPLSLHSAIVLE